MSKILLITYHPLLAINGGTYFYKAIIESIPKDKLLWIGTGAPTQKRPSWMKGFQSYIFSSFIFKRMWLRLFNRFPGRIINTVLLYCFYSRFTAHRILRIIEAENIGVIWIESVKQTIVIGEFLSKHTSVPIHLSVNDDYGANSSWIERKLILESSFKYLLERVKSADFISTAMVDYYKKTQVYVRNNYKIFWIGNEIKRLEPPLIQKPLRKIILFGSAHGTQTVESFCSVIDELNSEGQEIVLNIYSGHNYSKLSNKYKSVHFMGNLCLDELVATIRSHDMVYVPFPFEKKHKVLSSTSMPSKMLLALQCQIPILAHGPKYASNIKFVNEYEVGSSINTNEHSLIKKLYSNISYNDRKSASRKEIMVYDKYFNIKAQVEDYKMQLGLASDD